MERRRSRKFEMMIWLFLVLLLPIVIPRSAGVLSWTDPQPPASCSGEEKENSLACEVEEAKLKIARLESVLDKRIGEINARIQGFEDIEKKVEKLNSEIGRLKNVLSISEQDRSITSRKMADLEEEVKNLWAASRRSNFEIYNLESMAKDSERRLKELSSKVEEVNDIVTEQWIQIQRLDQAVYTAKLRTLKVKEFWSKCPFIKYFIDFYTDCLKAVKELVKPYSPKYKYISTWCKYQALNSFAVAKEYHHQLQSFIRLAMQSNNITSALAHEEVVFFVASALVALPIMTACIALLQFST